MDEFVPRFLAKTSWMGTEQFAIYHGTDSIPPRGATVLSLKPWQFDVPLRTLIPLLRLHGEKI